MFLQQSAAEQRRLLETVIEKATWKDGQLQTALGGEGMIAYASNISSASTVSSPRARVAAYGWQTLAGKLATTVAPSCQSFSRPRNAARLQRSIRTRATSEVRSRWRGTASARASIATSNTRFPASLAIFERRSIRSSQAWLANGTAGLE